MQIIIRDGSRHATKVYVAQAERESGRGNRSGEGSGEALGVLIIMPHGDGAAPSLLLVPAVQAPEQHGVWRTDDEVQCCRGRL